MPLFRSRIYQICKDLLGRLLHKVVGELRDDAIHRGVLRVVQRKPLVLGALEVLEGGRGPLSNTRPFAGGKFAVTATSHSLTDWRATSLFTRESPCLAADLGNVGNAVTPGLLPASILFP